MGHQPKRYLGAQVSDKGVNFCVWAPFAQTVSVLVGEPYAWNETIMEKSDDGHWSAFVADANIGQLYEYRITTADGTVLEKNDPRARQLTVSDNGSSVIPDPSFDWGEVKQPSIPKEQQVIYELHIGTFNRPDASNPGTFATAIEKLDYLQNLGINMIELMPVTSIAMSNGWGYAPNHLFSVENAYGGRRGLLEFVKACHERGIGVILDIVYNHFYPETDLWQFDGWSENNYGGIYFYNDPRGETPWGGRPDYGRAEVREFLLDNITMWLTEYRVDGLRIDSTIYMRNVNGPDGDASTAIPEAWSLLQEMNTLAHKINPDVTMIAEDSSGDAAITAAVKDGGAGFDSQWGISFPQGVRQFLGLENHNPYDGSLRRELEQYYNGQAYQKIVFGDSHDTAANGSVRINEAATPGNASSLLARQCNIIANAITLTAPGVPMILQGEEFMQPGNFNDWKMLEWDKTSQFAGIVLAHQHLINLRKNTYDNTAGLTGNSFELFHEDLENNIVAYRRWNEGGPNDDVIIIINGSDQRFEQYQLPLTLPGLWHVRFNSSWNGYSPDFQQTAVSDVTPQEGVITLELSDYNVLILGQSTED
jgi:1,4-alpha-glucan branching enzyme